MMKYKNKNRGCGVRTAASVLALLLAFNSAPSLD